MADFAEAQAKSGQDAVPVILKFLNQSAEIFDQHTEDLKIVVKNVQNRMPQRMARTIDKFLDMVAMPSTKVYFDTDSVNENSGRAAICEKVSAAMTNISAYKNLGDLREMINASTKLLPTLSALMPDLKPEVSTLVHNLVQIGTIETGALQAVSR